LKEDGWPFPQYLGACGRIVLETFEGNPLLDFYNKPWKTRARSVARISQEDKFFHLYSLFQQVLFMLSFKS